MATLTADIAEIAHILKRERYHRDTAQWSLCRAAFHPDASKTYINVAWFVQSVFCCSKNNLLIIGCQV
jgi:hypothetical protein